MNWTPPLRLSLLACTVGLFGCPPSNPSTGGGQEWDGGYTPLAETGNWVDTGRLSPCTLTQNAGDACGDLSNFDLSACDRGTLANAAREGLHMLTLRYDTTAGGYYAASPLTLGADGGTDLLGGQPVTESLRDGNGLFLSQLTTYPDGGTRRMSLASCEAPQAPDFTGCFVYCRNGMRAGRATFAANRLTWRAGESEASGLELVSESFVDVGMPVDLYVTRGHAYVVSINRNGRTGGLTVFDVSNPAAPVRKKVLEVPGDSYWNGVWAKGDALYVASGDRGVLVFDLGNPADPLFLRNLPGENTNVHTVFVDGDRLYATDDSAVLLFDISTPTRPVLLGRYVPPVVDYYASPHDMFAVGNRLYVNHGYMGFIVADTTDPQDIRTLGTYDFDNHYSHASAVGTFGGRTLAFMGGEGPGEHLRVLDVTDPAHMVKLGSFQLRAPISIHNMLLVGERLYLSWYQEGVRVLDVSNPAQPKQVAYYNTYRETDPGRGGYYDGAIGIRVPGDGYVYTVDTSRGMLILREP